MSSFPVSAYVELHKLKGGHSNTVNCVAFSPNGAYLASGGDDYVLVIWHVLQGRQLYRTLFRSGVDYVLWHPTLPDTVIVGCANGSLQQIHEFSLNNSEQHDIHLGARSTIHYLDYHSTSGRLAVSMGEEVHITRERTPNHYSGDVVLARPPEPKGLDEEDPRLRAVALQFNEDGTSLVVSYLAHGISCWDTSTWEARWHIAMPTAKPLIGGAAISARHRYIVLYNVKDGLDLYTLGPQKKAKAKKSFKFDNAPRSKHHLQVKYIHEGHGIISGTTCGQVCIWETTSGEVCQNLEHGNDVVQAVDATIQDKLCYIAAGTAACGQDTYIKIWRARITQERGSSLRESVVDLVQSFEPRQAPLYFFAVLLLIAVAIGCVWACSQTPWAALLDTTVFYAYGAGAIALGTARAFGVACHHGSLVLVGYLCAIAAYLQELGRLALRQFLFSVLPELAAGVAHGVVEPAGREDLHFAHRLGEPVAHPDL